MVFGKKRSLGLAMMVLFFLLGCSQKDDSKSTFCSTEKTPETEQIKFLDKCAPSFILPSLEGEEVIFDYQFYGSPVFNKITYLLFFASWCPHCQHFLPYYERISQHYSGNQDINFLAIRTGRRYEEEDINEFVKRLGLTFLILSDHAFDDPSYNKISKLFEIDGVPSTFVIYKDGRYLKEPDIETYEEFEDKTIEFLDNVLLLTQN